MDISLLENNQTILLDAIRNGKDELVYQLIDAGSDPDMTGSNGNTLLHEAVKLGNIQLAVFLLSRGADYTIRNNEKQTALSTEFTDISTVHRIRQEYQRLALYPYNSRPDNKQINTVVDQLNKDGLVCVKGLLDPEPLSALKSGFEKFIKRTRIKRFLRFDRYKHYDQKEYWRSNHRAYVTNDAILYSPELIELCSNTIIKNIANYYLGKPAYVKRTYGMRYLSHKSISSNQFHWHHDMEDRQLKAFILLTDVNDNDQYMEYVKGSHITYHPYENYFKNNLDFDYYSKLLSEIEIIKTTGKAGDIFLFDSNGMHRGTRSNGRVRDAYFIEYTASNNINNFWGSESNNTLTLQAKKDKENPFYKMFNVIPKWIRAQNQPQRKHSSWIEALEKPESWV